MTEPKALYVPPQIEKRERLKEVAQSPTTVSGTVPVKGGCFKQEKQG
jgi:hypothetical protein